MSASACPRCTLPLPEEAPAGLCLSCVLAANLERPALEEDPPDTPFGDYLLGERLGKGGMGIVYKAQRAMEPMVALKRLADAGADDEDITRFREEIRAAAGLDHPNIVRIFDFGEVDGEPFFTMELMEDSLEGQLDQYRRDRLAACALLEDIARAVHYGHQRAVIHRDLKPANILLTADGTAKVADFGTAKQLFESHGLTRSGTIVGTLAYMAPEQARPGEPLTTAVDVHALGAILYELLTGEPPFIAASPEQIFHRLLTEDPVPPRSVDETIPRSLETICLKCLEKEPERRYHSAEALADDLGRFRRGERPAVSTPGALSRAWRSTRRHPALAGLIAALISAVAVTASNAAAVVHSQERELRAEVLASNRYAARMAAGTVLFQLRAQSDRVEQASRAPDLIAMLEQNDLDGLADAGLAAGMTLGDPAVRFESWLMLDTAGMEVQRWPSPPPGYELRRDFSFRDYFQGVVPLGRAGSREVHVSRAFKSEADGHMKFGISAPMYGADGGWVGVMVGMLTADSALGPTVLTDLVDGGTTTGAILSPRDRERQEANGPLPADYVYVVHDGLQLGTQVVLRSAVPRALQELAVKACSAAAPGLPTLACVKDDDDFRDEVPGFEGRWLAGFAPVGGTPLVVVVQTRDAAAQQPGAVLLSEGRAGLLWMVGCAALGLLVFGGLRRRPRRELRP